MLVMKDEAGRSPLDIACYLRLKNVVIYLLTKYGTPSEFISNSLNVDNEGRNAYHSIIYKGNFEILITMLNYERVCLRKVIFDEL